MYIGARDQRRGEPRGAVVHRARRVLRRWAARHLLPRAARARRTAMTLPAGLASERAASRARSSSFSPMPSSGPHAPGLWVYLLVGVAFGIVLTKSEVISWFRIQEMFRFQGFHMFGVFATALPTATVGVQLLKR